MLPKFLRFPFFILAFCIVAVFSRYFLSLTNNIAYAQLSGCGSIELGNSGPNVTIPAQCFTEGGNQAVVAWAEAHLKTATYIMGTPDRNWGANPANPPHFDCSGYVGMAWYKGTSGKVSMWGQTCSDWNDSTGKYQKFTPAQVSQIQPGDLVYFTGGDPCTGARPGDVTGPGHVTMYVGKYTCGASDCLVEYYSSGLPGMTDSLAQHMKQDHMWGFLRPKG